MRKLQLLLVFFSIAVIIGMDSCSSGKSAYEHGNYYEAVITSVGRLRKNTDHKKSSETLRQAYPLAVTYFEEQARNALSSNAQFKWTSVVQAYTSINLMYDEIKRSPGAMAVIPNPVSYHAKLDEAKRNAAEENYQAGILALSAGNRDKAKQAYRYFKTANEFVVGYKDVIKMMEQALWDATVKVLITPIPVTKNVAWSAQFFDDKVSEFLHGAPINEFVKFYTYSEAQTLKLNPDQIIELSFDEFMVGQVQLHEKEIQLEKDSVVLATYITQNAGQTSPATGSNVAAGNTNSNAGSTTTTGGGNNTTGSNTANNNTNTATGNSSGNSTGQNTGSENINNSQNSQANSGNTGNNQNQGNNGNEEKTDSEDKVTICHKPPGNTENAKTLIIPRSALQAHLDHGDALGYCEETKEKGKPEDNKKPEEKKQGSNNGGKPQGSSSILLIRNDQLVASTSRGVWFASLFATDTTKVYGKVKATYYHFQKTTTSKGIVSFRILDSKTKAILSAEKMPSEYIWISEWATFNGDERALSPLQLEIARQREKVPPPVQDLFIEFSKPIYTQITTKIQEFYKGY